jgi:hypothetical protein
MARAVPDASGTRWQWMPPGRLHCATIWPSASLDKIGAYAAALIPSSPWCPPRWWLLMEDNAVAQDGITGPYQLHAGRRVDRYCSERPATMLSWPQLACCNARRI